MLLHTPTRSSLRQFQQAAAAGWAFFSPKRAGDSLQVVVYQRLAPGSRQLRSRLGKASHVQESKASSSSKAIESTVEKVTMRPHLGACRGAAVDEGSVTYTLQRRRPWLVRRGRVDRGPLTTHHHLHCVDEACCCWGFTTTCIPQMHPVKVRGQGPKNAAATCDILRQR